MDQTKYYKTSSLMILLAIGSILFTSPNGCFSHSIQSSDIQAIQNQAQINSYTQVTVQTTSGILNGTKQTLSNVGPNSNVFKFLSVPYAKAPIGELRFQRPVEIIKDQSAPNELIDATKFGKTCPQFRHLTRFISPLLNIDPDHQTSEDCLHLNVFVPSSVGSLEQNSRLEPNKQLPVLVWIPGEGFDFADARQFDGSYLAHKTQSIVVTVQYRVGILGFLHAPQLGIKGNMGIYDQIMALRWVRKNIANFGGDADRVTLMGRFSGSMSISVMLTAPKQDLLKLNGQPLFNRVALLSGVAVDNWIIDSHQAERVQELLASSALKSTCAHSKPETCLKTISADQLLPIAGYGWRLVKDDELIGQAAPIEAIIKNQVANNVEAVLIGETGMEGTLCLYRHMLNTQRSNYAKLIEEDRLTTDEVYEIIKDDSVTYFRYNQTNRNPIETALETLIEESLESSSDYIDSGSKSLRDKYLNACSSYMVKSHLNRFKRNLLASNQYEENRMNSNKKSVEVYHYELKYKPTFSLAPDYIKTAAHGDDIPLIFGLVYNQLKRDISESDLLMSRKIMSYIGNFVHGNNPLLSQHSSIDSSSRTSADNETVNMDDNDTLSLAAPEQLIARQVPTGPRRNWSSSSRVYQIEFNDRDLNEISRFNQQQTVNTTSSQDDNKPYKITLKLLILSRPQWNLANNMPQPEVTNQHVDQFVEPDSSIGQFDSQPSRRISDSYRQQQWHSNDEQNPIFPHYVKRTQSPLIANNQQHPSSTHLINDSSFMTLLLFSSCMAIFAMTSFCLGLCLLVFRYNIKSAHVKKQQGHHFAGSNSSCNICDDSQGSSIDAVLTGNRKDARGFCNVFAKLKGPNTQSFLTGSQMQNNSASIPNQIGCTSASSASTAVNRQQGQTQTDLITNTRTSS